MRRLPVRTVCEPVHVRQRHLRLDGPGEREARQQSGDTQHSGWMNHVDLHSLTRRSRKAFVTTETELIAIAAPAKIGDSSNPKNGYSTPAAIGTPSAL